MENAESDLIASATLVKVGNLLNELNVALPALQRVLDQVAPAAGGAKRRRVVVEVENRPLKQLKKNLEDAPGETTLWHELGTADAEIVGKEPHTVADGETLGRATESDVQNRTDGVTADETTSSQDANVSIDEGNGVGKAMQHNSKSNQAEKSDFLEAPNGALTHHMEEARTANQASAAVSRDKSSADGPGETNETDSGPVNTDHSAKARDYTTGSGNAADSKFAVSFKTIEDREIDKEEALLDRTSVVLLTLSQMAKLRGNRPPTSVENNLMTEAYDNVYRLASKVAPRDLVSKRAIDRTLCGLGLREREQSLPPEHAPETPKAANHIQIKVSPSVAAITAAAAQELLVKQGRAQIRSVPGKPDMDTRVLATPGAGSGTPAAPPSQALERTPSNVRFGPPLAGQVTPAEAAAIALAAGQGKVLTDLDRQIRAAGQPPSWQIGIPTGLPDRKATQKKIEAHLREQQQLMTQFRQVEMIEQHVAGRLKEVQQQLDAYLSQERQMEDQSLSMVAEVQLKLSQLRHDVVGLQTHQQQLAKAKKTVLQKHVAIQHEKQILATAPFLAPRASVEFPVTCPVCQHQETITPAIIVCDVCNRGYHIRCVLPPQTGPFPNDYEWACPVCRAHTVAPPRALPPLQGGGFTGRASPLGALAASLGASVSQAATPNRSYYSGGVGSAHGLPPDPKLLDLLGPAEHRTPLGMAGPSDVSKLIPADVNKFRGDVSKPIRGDVILGTPVLEGVVLQRPDRGTHPTVENDARSGGAATPGEGGGVPVSTSDVRSAAKVFKGGNNPLLWVGGGSRHEDGSVHYTECKMNGRTYRVWETVELRSDTSDSPPFVGRIQALWEDSPPGQQRVRVNWCYAPGDIPSSVQTPEASGVREVYESNHSDDNPVGSILGPCLLLPQQAFEEELEHRRNAGIGPFAPLYLCNWSYDARSGKFLMKSR